jgi:hypothetical protein
MAERPDLRQIAASLRESLAGLDRDALVDILTYVLNEYVVEGPPPLAASQVERLEDLAGLGLAGLVAALQVRLDVPGLELFRVEGDEVRVQTPAGWVALQPGRPAAPPADAARPDGRAGVRMVEQPMPRPATMPGLGPSPGPTGPAAGPAPAPGPVAPTGRASADEALARGRGDLIGGERGVITPPAPRPRGLSVSGRPSAAPPAPAEPAPASPPAQAQPPAAQPERKEDDASIRFSLLELD